MLDALTDLFILRGVPGFIRSDNGPELVAQAVRDWIATVGARTTYIEPGSPWENGDLESLSARLRDELLNGEIFDSVREARIVIEDWRRHFNQIRPHSALGWLPPAPEVVVPPDPRPPMHHHSTPTTRWGPVNPAPSDQSRPFYPRGISGAISQGALDTLAFMLKRFFWKTKVWHPNRG